jgi:hypothetical protein
MSVNSSITTFGIALLLMYGLTKILEFYGVGISSYGSYIAFYIFILISMYILPNNYYSIK